ncbi:MAG: Rieske 2Fe-2S domain-containing protein [Candidatus Rokubacteria bacterium]|nr:Rieske 2Fe-2S domain-containing protein [Candidatus Rokubacteria bacterium]
MDARGNGEPGMAESVVQEAYGASQIGPFDYCPKLGFREYWYPGIEARRVRGTPVHLKMLGEDLVVFRDAAGRVVALSDWCPHRGARLSLGLCEFKGTVTCPYHGYVFDGTGQCVAGLIERPDSPFIAKLRARAYPTEERLGIVFVWMGETAPVPLDEDLPAELSDPELTGARYLRVKVWDANWTEPMAQGIDFHEFYLHRGLNVWRLLNYRLPFFRPKLVYTSGVKITSEGDAWVDAACAAPHFGQAYYPGLDAKWPRHVWWRRLAGGVRFRFGDSPLPRYAGVQHNVELPSKIRVIIGASVHLRWNVPVTEHDTRVWTFTLVRKPKSFLHAAWQALWYHTYRKPAIIIATNEQEDLVVFKRERLNLERPQKLGPLDAGLIYFRRHLAQRARDYQRLGAARGALKPLPPRPAKDERLAGAELPPG